MPLGLGAALKKRKNSGQMPVYARTQEAKNKGREFISGGTVMPDAILIFVPQSNLERLNEASKLRWRELKNLKSKNRDVPLE